MLQGESRGSREGPGAGSKSSLAAREAEAGRRGGDSSDGRSPWQGGQAETFLSGEMQLGSLAIRGGQQQY